MDSEDTEYDLYKSLVKEHSIYYANSQTDYVCQTSVTASSSMSSLLLGSEGSEGAMDEFLPLTIDEEIDRGTRCYPHFVRLCPLEVTLLSPSKLGALQVEERVLFGDQQKDVLDKRPSLCDKNIFNFKSHFKNLRNGDGLGMDYNSVLHGFRILAFVWTFVSALFVSQVQHKPESNVFWCGLTNKVTKHSSNTTLVSTANILHPDPFRLLLRGSVASFYIFLFISGYILSHQLITEYRDAGYISISNFYLKRLLRIFPSLCAAYVLYRFFRAQDQTVCKPWTNAIFINNFFEDQLSHQCFDNSWIISVFVQLFLILPWLILAMFVSVWNLPDEIDSEKIGHNYLGPTLIYIAIATNLGFRVLVQMWSVSDDNVGQNGLAVTRCQLSSKFYFDFSPFLIGILFSFNRHQEIRLKIKKDEDRRHNAMIGSLSPVLKPSISPQRIKKLSKAIVDSNFLVSKNITDDASKRPHVLSGMKTPRMSPGRSSAMLEGSQHAAATVTSLAGLWTFLAIVVSLIVMVYGPTPEVGTKGMGIIWNHLLVAVEPIVFSIAIGLAVKYAKTQPSRSLFYYLFNIKCLRLLSTTSYSTLLVHKIVIYAGVHLKILDDLIHSDDVSTTFLKELVWFAVHFLLLLPVAFFCGLVLSIFVERPFRALVM